MKKIFHCFDLKTVVTIIVTVTVVVGFFKGLITSEQFVPLATMVFMFYFNKKDSNNEK